MAFKKISFIVATVDRDKELQQCIASIEKAHDHKKEVPIEILIIVQKAKQKKNIQIIYPAITTIYYIDRLGLSAARNIAIEKSMGDYLVFIDDDAFVKEDFIKVLAKEIIAHPETGAFCGRLIDPVRQEPFSPLFAGDKGKQLGRRNYQNFMGSAHILSKTILDRVGSYDERFGVGAKYFGSEETDMFFRLLIAGEKVLYLPKIVFYHQIPVVPSSYVYKYAYAVGAVMTKTAISDQAHSPEYILMLMWIIVKALARLLQKIIFGGKYTGMNKLYHYGSVIRGTIDGIAGYLKRGG